jgi:hypothetical protein
MRLTFAGAAAALALAFAATTHAQEPIRIGSSIPITGNLAFLEGPAGQVMNDPAIRTAYLGAGASGARSPG